MGRGLLLLMLTALLAGAGPACAQDPAGRFDGWATAVIAADWRDGGGQPIAAFDNARRDVARGLIEAGLPRDSLVDYSLRPDAAEPVTVAEAPMAEALETAAVPGDDGPKVVSLDQFRKK